jgi:hypothetical protein
MSGDDAQDPFLHDPQAFERMLRVHDEDPARRFAELAAYHVGLFTGAASRVHPVAGAMAHALFLLIEEATRRREEWLQSLQPDRP